MKISKKNFVKTLSDEERTLIAQQVLDGFVRDENSMEDYRERMAEWRQLYFGRRDSKDTPWENCSNVSLPEITISNSQSHARHIQALFPGKEIVKMLPLGLTESDRKKADRQQMFLNKHLMYKSPEYRTRFSTSISALSLDGTVIRKSWWNSKKSCIETKMVKADNFTVSYHASSLEDAPRITETVRLPVHSVKRRIKSGYFCDFDFPNDSADTVSNDVRDGNDADNYMSRLGAEKDGVVPRTFYEQYRYFELDGELVYCCAIVDDEYEILVHIRKAEDSEGCRQIPYTRYVYLVNPNGGFFGVGFGYLLLDISNLENTLINQLVDAGTLSNLRGGFVSRRSNISRGNLSFSMGEFKEVDIKVEDLRKAIMEVNHAPPSAVSFQLLGKLQEYASKVTTVTEMVTGQMPSSDTAASSTLALLEQGMQVFTSIHKQTHSTFGTELKLYRRLLAENINKKLLEEYYRFVIDEEALQQEAEERGIDFDAAEASTKAEIREDFAIDSFLDIQPVSDPNIMSRVERVNIAQQLMTTVTQNPLLAQVPKVILAVTEKFLTEVGVEQYIINDIIGATQGHLKEQSQGASQQLMQMLQQLGLPPEIMEQLAVLVQQIGGQVNAG